MGLAGGGGGARGGPWQPCQQASTSSSAEAPGRESFYYHACDNVQLLAKEKRLCPDDGKMYTFDELKKAYSRTLCCKGCFFFSSALAAHLISPLSRSEVIGHDRRMPVRVSVMMGNEVSTLPTTCKHIGEMPWRLRELRNLPSRRKTWLDLLTVVKIGNVKTHKCCKICKSQVT